MQIFFNDHLAHRGENELRLSKLSCFCENTGELLGFKSVYPLKIHQRGKLEKCMTKQKFRVGLFKGLHIAWGSPLVAQMVKNLPVMQETWMRSLVRKIPWRRKRLPTPVLLPAEFHGQRSLASYSP